MPFSILIVDDSAPIRQRVAALLSSLPGVTSVTEASGVVSARGCLAGWRPDLIVLDVRMPDGSGIDLLREIRAAGVSSSVIMHTNYQLEPYRHTCFAAGADFFLDKSTESDRLARIVAQLAREAGVQA